MPGTESQLGNDNQFSRNKAHIFFFYFILHRRDNCKSIRECTLGYDKLLKLLLTTAAMQVKQIKSALCLTVYRYTFRCKKGSSPISEATELSRFRGAQMTICVIRLPMKSPDS